MKKDILNITQFLLENNTWVGKEITNLVIYCNSLKVVFSEIENEPEYIIVSIKEGMQSQKVIVSELVSLEKLKPIIIKVWEQIEKSKNKDFINQYGITEYEYFRKAYLSAISGEKENDRFKFKLYQHFDKLEIVLEDKSTGLNNCGILNYSNSNLRNYTCDAAIINAGAILKSINNQDKWIAEQFNIIIPAVNFENYKLGLSVSKSYNSDNMFEYLVKQLKTEESKKILSVFELQNDLKNDLKNDSLPNKKLKI